MTTLTPTGVLVTDAPPQSDEWYAARREGITGTDLPKILGYSKYGNALAVWLDKRGELEDTAGEAARWGTLFEDIVANEWAERVDCYVEPVGILKHAAYEWRRVSLDRLVHACPDRNPKPHSMVNAEVIEAPVCGLEVKTRSAFVARDWKDGIPDDVLAQVQWGIHVAGFDHMHVAALIGGQRLVPFRVDRDPQIIDYLVEQAEVVWEAVVNGDPPAALPDADGVLLDLLDKVYRQRQGERELSAAEAQPWLDRYTRGHRLATIGERVKTEAKTALVQLLGDGDTGLVDEIPRFTYKAPAPGVAFPAKQIARLKADHPRVYARLVKQGYIIATEPGPRFNVKAVRD